MIQGEIWNVNLDPVKGSEQSDYRPVVILSGNLMNSHLNVIICCPLTTKIKNYKDNIVLDPDKENNLKKTSEALIFHIRSISKERFIKRIGKIKDSEVQELKNNLNDILKY